MMKRLLLSSITLSFGLYTSAIDKIDDVYQIGTAKELVEFAMLVNEGHNEIDAQLTSDINASGVELPVIGSRTTGYAGTFDGQNHTVTIRRLAATAYSGLFGHVKGGTIMNLRLAGTIQTAERTVGGICGWAVDATFLRCISSASIFTTFKGDAAQAGICSCTGGYCVIRDCLFDGEIRGSETTCCGGLVGWCADLTVIDNCLSIGRLALSPTDDDSFMLGRNPKCVRATNNYVRPSAGCDSHLSRMQVDDRLLANGNVGFMLNQGRTDGTWTQDIGSDPYPIPFPTGHRISARPEYIAPPEEVWHADTTNIRFPDWARDMIIYEIATKSFNSPRQPEQGTFRSIAKRMPYLKRLGINTIWLTGHSWSDAHHFYNIWTQYACVRPDSLDPSLGTRREFRDMIKCAHRNGIRVLLDVITHGVMGYSPLVEEHPDWFRGGSWGMTDYDWHGGHQALDEWWVKTWTDYAVEDGVDGFRLDVDMFRPDLWKQIRRNALEAGHEIVVIQEGHDRYVEGAADSYQTFNRLTVPGDRSAKGICGNNFVWDVGTYYAHDFPRETVRRTPQKMGAFLASMEVSCHDNGWDGFPSDQNPYVTNGSRSFMGYSVLLTPAIPILFMGEEWDPDYVPIPQLAGSLYGKERKSEGRWLYGSWLQWEQLKKREKKQMLDDTRHMLEIRRAYRNLIYATTTPQKAPIIPLEFTSKLKKRMPVPYIIYGKGQALLVAANPYDDEAQLDIRIPREVIGANEKDDVVLKDIWNKKGGKMRLSTDGIIHINITRDHIAGGGLSVFEIKYE